MKRLELKNKRFGRLRVLSFSHVNNGGQSCWLCLCDCGNKIVVGNGHLRNGHTKSCGCLSRENIINRSYKHGNAKRSIRTRLYGIWAGIKVRCYNTKSIRYDRYGGRGIMVCDEWKNDFAVFRDWAVANGYKDNLQIERVNNDGNYEPANCQWSDVVTQARNRSNNRYFYFKGEKLLLKDWALKYGISINTLIYRIYKAGWPIERALTIQSQ